MSSRHLGDSAAAKKGKGMYYYVSHNLKSLYMYVRYSTYM